MGVSNSSIAGQQVASPRPFLYRGTAEIPEGGALCLDWDNSTVADRDRIVEQPTLNNINHHVGFSLRRVPADSAGSDRWVDVVPVGLPIPGATIHTDENCAVEDLLGPVPGTFAYGRAVLGEPCFIVTTAVDRSAASSAGLVTGRWGPVPQEVQNRKLYRFFDDFYGDKTIVLGGFTPAEVLIGGYEVTGASVAAAYTSDAGGRLVLTPNTTNIAQIHPGAANFPIILSAGKSCFFRANVNFGVGAVDNDVFCGLAITGAAITDGTVPPLDDYLGFYMQGDSSGLINIATNRDNGTDNVTSTGITQVADAMHDLAFLVRNRLAGDLINNTTVQVWVDGVLTNTLSSAAVNALINKDEAMRPVFAGIGGAAAVAIEIDRWEWCYNK